MKACLAGRGPSPVRYQATGVPIMVAVTLSSFLASCTNGDDPPDLLTAAELAALITAVTDSLRGLAIDLDESGSFSSTEDDLTSGSIPDWFPDRLRVASDSLGVAEWSMDEGEECIMAFGLSIPPEMPPTGDPALQHGCRANDPGVFSVGFPVRREGALCPTRDPCWEMDIHAYVVRTKAGQVDGSFMHFRGQISRIGSGEEPVVRLELVSHLVS